MDKIVSCGVVMLNARHELFVCHTTGTSRWDLPKGVQDQAESALQTAVREAWEETSLAIKPETLDDLGRYDYLPTKQLHLFALRVAVDAFQTRDCRCHTTFPHRFTGLPTLEVDDYAWKPLEHLKDWCGKNMTRVLLALDWKRIELLPEISYVAVRAA
jgi:putative (di)nucleoside polyphosphate hydrolase